jgi:hypothetical protein
LDAPILVVIVTKMDIFYVLESQKTETNKRVAGALTDIIGLYSQVKISENFDLLARRIFDMVKKVHPEVTIGSSVVCTPTTTTKLAEPEIKSKFEHIFNNAEWTWEKILDDAKSTCGSLEEIITSDIDEHPAKVVQHFQVMNFA